MPQPAATQAAASDTPSRNQLASLSVSGLSGTGHDVVDLLLAMEVGTVMVADDRSVTADDPGYPAALTGMRRSAALRVMRQRHPSATRLIDVAQHGSTAEGADLMVWVSETVEGLSCTAHPENLLAEAPGRLPVLPIVLSAEHAVVGPLLNTPGTGCPECTALPRLLSQLTPAAQPGARPASRKPTPVMAAAAAAFAGMQIQALLHAERIVAVQHSACVLTAADASVTYHRISGDPVCACFTLQQ